MRNKELERKYLSIIVSTIDTPTVITDYIAYTDDEEIANDFYDTFKDELKRVLDVDNEVELVYNMNEETVSYKVQEKTLNLLAKCLSNYFTNLTNDEKVAFANLHSGVSDSDIIEFFFDYMVDTQELQCHIGSLELECFVSVDDIAEIEKLMETATEQKTSFSLKDLKTILSGYVPVLA